MTVNLLWALPVVLLLVVVGVVLARRSARRQAPPPATVLPPPRPPASVTRPAVPPPVMSRPNTADAQAAVDANRARLAAQRERTAEAQQAAQRRTAADPTPAARFDASRSGHPQASQAARPMAPPPVAAAPTATLQAAPRPIPQTAQHPAPRPTPATALPIPPQVSPQPPPRPAGPALVLVVDDSKVVRIKTSRLLEKHHYRVQLADDGLTALQCLEAQRPDLVITDVEMPGLDGFGLTDRMRNQPGWATVPVIMITSSNDKHRAGAAAAGVNVLLGKPYPEETLLAEVEKALSAVAGPAPAGMLLQ